MINSMNDYIKTTPFEDRARDSSSLLYRFPNCVPIICSMDPWMKTKKTYYKFLVNKDITLSMMTSIIRKKIELDHHHSIFIMNERNELVPSQSVVNVLYLLHKNKDGFLYLFARKENCFG